MTKFVLPLLVFACAGFSKDKNSDYLADILQGASREKVRWGVFDSFADIPEIALDAGLKESIETKLKLGMKRNKLSYDAIHSLALYSKIVVEVSANQIGTQVIGYTWSMNIGRYVNTPDGKKIQHEAYWQVAGGVVGNSAELKEKIDSTLDKIFLAYLELPEKKTEGILPSGLKGKPAPKPPRLKENGPLEDGK